MSEIENEVLETTEEVVEDIVETPIEEEVEIPQRVNPFCVISKDSIKVEDVNGKKHDLHMIETNSSWGENPYPEEYAVVPDEMAPGIMETRGFCDIMLSEDGTEVVSFTAREIPDIPTPEPEPTEEQKRIAELEAYQLEQDNMILENNFEILVLQEGIQDIV